MARGEARPRRGPARASRGGVAPAAPARPASPAPPRDRGRALPLHVALAALAGFACTLIWGLTTRGYFWPVWVWLGLAISVAAHALVLQRPARGRATRSAASGSASTCARSSPRSASWCGRSPAAATVAGVADPRHVAWGWRLRALFVYRDRLPWVREQELVERVDQLTRTRRGALDVQDSELRRIERDLHDGAQARLVALSMQLGRAEARLDRPARARRPRPPGARRGERGDRRAARPRARDRAAGARRPRARRRRRRARPARGDRRSPSTPTSTAARPR